MFTHIRQIDSSIISGALTTAIEALGIEVGNKASNLFERTKLFFAIPRSGVEVDLDVAGCDSFNVGDTSKGGLLEQNAAIGTCGGALSPRTISGVAPGFFSSRPFEATLFPSHPNGFGVVSGKYKFLCHLVCIGGEFTDSVNVQMSMIRSKFPMFSIRNKP